MMIKTMRVYDKPAATQGVRVLVDRLWPRGIRRDDGPVDEWMKAIAPSTELRRWFDHDAARWPEFKRRYFRELDAQPELVRRLREWSAAGDLVLLYGAREPRYNNANALREYLERPHGQSRQ